MSFVAGRFSFSVSVSIRVIPKSVKKIAKSAPKTIKMAVNPQNGTKLSKQSVFSNVSLRANHFKGYNMCQISA